MLVDWGGGVMVYSLDANGDGDTSDAGDATYTYDHRHQRVGQTSGGQTRTLLNDHQSPAGYPQIVEERIDAVPVRSYIVGHRVEGQSDAQGIVFLVRDGHGSTRALTDVSGLVIVSYDYAAYGEAIGFDPAAARTVHLFGGDAEYDRTSSFYYHDRRWRDTHRFISFDDYGGSNADPASLHKYLYTNANAISGVDPSGMFSLVEMLVDTGISGVISYVLSPIIKPAARYINETIFSALLPTDVMERLADIRSNLSAFMVGVNAGYTVSRGPFGIGGGGGLELLWSPNTHNWGVYAFADANISVLGGTGFGASVKAGVVFNTPDLGSYRGAFRSITLGYRRLPKKIKSIFANSVVNSHLLRIPPGTTSLIPSSVPGIEDAFLQQGKNLLADVFTRLDNKAITIFWSPYTAGSFGFYIESQFSEDGSSGISTGLQQYWLVTGDPADRLL